MKPDAHADAVALDATADAAFDTAADAQPLIAIRIVHIDHYTNQLHAYSSSTPFPAARLSAAPLHSLSRILFIRIFGTTPATQHCCLYLHGLRPYMHIAPHPLSPESLFRFYSSLYMALEAPLRSCVGSPNHPAVADDPATAALEAADAAPIAHISDVEPVVARYIYGFDVSSHTFLKI